MKTFSQRHFEKMLDEALDEENIDNEEFFDEEDDDIETDEADDFYDEDEDVEEDDMLRGKPHNNHLPEAEDMLNSEELNEKIDDPSEVVTVGDLIEILEKRCNLDDKILFRVNKQQHVLYDIYSKGGTAVVDLVKGSYNILEEDDILAKDHVLTVKNFNNDRSKNIVVKNLTDDEFKDLDKIVSLSQVAPLSNDNEQKLSYYIKKSKCRFLEKFLWN